MSSSHAGAHGVAAQAAAPPHVLVFPFPAAGHMTPLLDLAHILSLRSVSITVLVTPKNVPLLQPLLSRSPTISTLVLPFPSNHSLPAAAENLRSLPPTLFPAMIHALGALHSPLLSWARSAVTPPDAIISDFFLGWTRATAAELGIPRLVFCPSGAAALAVVHRLWLEMPKVADSDEETLGFPSIPGSPIYTWYQISPIYRAYREGDERWEFIKKGFLDNISSWGYIFNSFSAVESDYLRYLRTELGHARVWAVGPLLPPGGAATAGRGAAAGEGVLGWLEDRAEGSVVYVCFGSQAMLNAVQTEAVAAALENSGAAFVWVVGGGESPPIPPGFEERTAERGRVVRGWAPQPAILSHTAVGSFLTHCGWNSVLEGIVAGVILLTWPMAADQFVNARLVGELGLGLRACERIDVVPDPDDLARVVARSVDASLPERARVVELREEAVKAMKEGGDSHREISDLLGELRRQKTLPH